ncbi:grasp-with-spasm system SPASM domain peptide maturase [Aquimarina sp. SS2-1]|uniref:grasp-with-spasm system SPASM domain peptide maturase n=1 Tax=Aquimarina besae TaxID=3342247 RepID=UPI00366FA190
MKLKQIVPFKLIASCVPVKGAQRSTICDLQRGDVKMIPNDLFKILNEHEGRSIKEIKKTYHNKYDSIIDEYFQFLLDHEFILFTSTPELFPKMSMDWYEPAEITHAILDIGEESNYDIYKALTELNDLHCKHIEFRSFKNIKLKELIAIIEFIEALKSSIISIDFTIPYSCDFETEIIQKFLFDFPRVSSFRFYGTPETKFIPPIDGKRGYIIYAEKMLKNEKFCGIVDSSLFSVNIKTFTESLKHNSCLNRKVAIDRNGDIKNCPSMSKSFGSIDKKSIKDALQNTDYKKYWNIHKDQIETCKDCEFRYICTDCRAYIENPKDLYSKPLKCGYNPYNNTWEDWETNPLKKEAMNYYDLLELKDVNE